MSSHIRARKHSHTSRTKPLATLLTLAFPAAAMAQQAVTLPEVDVQGQASAYKADVSANPKYTQPLVDTPQTITVIKKELMEQQGVKTLTEALRNSPGVGTFYLGENGTTNTGDAIYMRGLDASSSIFVDNVRDIGSVSRDMFNIEQVEVLKGPAGTDNGRGSPTGSINLVTKQAQDYDFFTTSATYGSWNQKRATADWNKVLNADTGTAFRLNLMKQDSGVPGRHQINNNDSGVAMSLANGLGTDTRVFLDYLHSQQNDVPDGGVPTIGLPGYSSPDTTRPYISNAPGVNSSNFYGLATDYNKVNVDRLTLRVERDISPDVKLQNTTRYGRTSQNYLLTSFMGTTANLLTPGGLSNLGGWTLARSNPTVKDQVNTILTNQTYVTANVQTGDIKHTLMSGFELTQEKQDNNGYNFSGTLPAANLYNPNPFDGSGTWARAGNSTLNASGKINTVSAYLFDTVKLSDRWMLNGGLRLDRYSMDYSCGQVFNTTTSVWGNCATSTTTPGNPMRRMSFSNSGTLSNFKIAAIYKPTIDSSIYALYATSQQPPGGGSFALSSAANSGDNPNFSPQKTKTAEIGTKWEVLEKRLSLTAALFRTQVNNNVVQDPTTLQYFQIGQQIVQGVELGAVGSITRNWDITAGYSHMNTQVVNTAAATAAGENVLAYTPKDSLTTWTTYRLGSFTVGGGARYVSKLLRGTDGAIGTPAFANAYWVFDGMASYTVTKNLDLRLNVYNLFDKDYVAAINKSGYRYVPGMPRAATITATLRF